MTKNHPATQLIIARHGNTFRAGEPPRRIGARTDLPLVERDKATALGEYLKLHFLPDVVYCSPLLRTRQTAEIALQTAGLIHLPLNFDDRFLEIDYGPDENKTEDEVIHRIGQRALDLWNSEGVLPDGWAVDVEQLKATWIAFFQELAIQHQGHRILVVTSNGIARFAPVILAELPVHISSLKMKTGHISLFEKKLDNDWQCEFWDKSPKGFIKV